MLILPYKTKGVDTEVYKWSSITVGEISKKESSLKMPVLTASPLSYEEARKRAVNPLSDDAIICWYVKDNFLLERIGQLVVLPGFEIKAPWEDAVRCILHISDIIIYTVDWRRKAQASSGKIEEWIKEADVAWEPILVFTKSDIMTKEQKESIKELSKPYEVLFVGTGEESAEEYENLWKKISESLLNPSPRKRVFRFRTLLSKIRNILDNIKKIAKQKETEEIFTQSRVLDEYINFLNEEWEKVTRTLIISRVKSILSRRVEESLEYARKVSKSEFGGFGQKVKLWLFGGPEVKKIIKIENALKRNFLKGLDKEIEENIFNEFEKIKIENKKEKTKINWTQYTFHELVNNPLPKLGHKMDEIIEDIKKAGEMSEELVEFFRGRIKDTQKLAKAIVGFREFVTSEKKDVLLPALITKESIDTLKRGLNVLGVIGGGALSAGEATGAITITSTKAASIISGAAGIAVAVVSAISIYASIVRVSRKMEWEVERWSREYTSQMYRQVLDQFIIKLDQFWEIMKFYIKRRLTELMGLNKEIKDRMSLYVSLEDAKEKLINAEKEIL